LYLIFAVITGTLFFIFRARITDFDRLYPVLSNSFYPGESGKYYGFNVEAPASDGTLYLFEQGHFVKSDQDLRIDPPFRYTLQFTRGISSRYYIFKVLSPSIAFKLYFARSPAGEYYYSYNENAPYECGFFLETPEGEEKLDSGGESFRFPEFNHMPRFDLFNDGKYITASINGHSRETFEAADIEYYLFRLEPRDYSNNLLLQKAVIEKRNEDSDSIMLAYGGFHLVPFFFNVPANLRNHVSEGAIVIASLVLILACAFLFDTVTISLLAFRPLKHLCWEEFLFLLIPVQVVFLSFLRSTFALPVCSLGAAVVLIGIAKFIHLLVSDTTESESLKGGAGRFFPLIPALSLLVLFFYSPELSSGYIPHTAQPTATGLLIPAAAGAVCVCGLVFTQSFQPAAFLLTVIQLFSFYLFNSFSPGTGEYLFGAVALIPWLLSAIIHTAKNPGKPIVASRLFLISIIVLLAWFVELGVRGNGFLNNKMDVQRYWRESLWGLVDRSDLFNRIPQTEVLELAGVKHERKKPPERFRIVCLGSSSTEGQGIEDISVSSYPRRLEGILAKNHRNIEVVNGGMGGAPLYSLKIYLEEVLLKLDPDLVVLYFGRNGDRPGLDTYYKMLKKEAGDAPFICDGEKLWAATRLRWNPPWLLDGFLKAAEFRLFMGCILLADLFRRDEYFSNDVTEERVFLEETVSEIVRLCVENGVEILLVPEVDFSHAIHGTGAHPCYAVFEDMAQQYRGNGVYYKNILGAFSPEVAAWAIVDDVHMNRDGYLFLAEQIEKVLYEYELLPGPHRADSRS